MLYLHNYPQYEQRLQHRREHEIARRASETVEQREDWLHKSRKAMT